jgi:hypothetical protein
MVYILLDGRSRAISHHYITGIRHYSSSDGSSAARINIFSLSLSP